ncbi:hypothetical protein, partial [Nocardia puris]|uniref:hypothetical protein n=1 Tax=Nocardia puris TaxID=208602 RepID=UPI001E4E047A
DAVARRTARRGARRAAPPLILYGEIRQQPAMGDGHLQTILAARRAVSNSSRWSELCGLAALFGQSVGAVA